MRSFIKTRHSTIRHQQITESLQFRQLRRTNPSHTQHWMVVFTGGMLFYCHMASTSMSMPLRGCVRPIRIKAWPVRNSPKCANCLASEKQLLVFFVPENTGIRTMAHFLNSRCSTNRSMLRPLDGMIIYDLWYERVMKVLQRLTLVAPTLKKVDAQALHWGGLSLSHCCTWHVQELGSDIPRPSASHVHTDHSLALKNRILLH